MYRTFRHDKCGRNLDMSLGVEAGTRRRLWSVFYTALAHLSQLFSVLGNIRDWKWHETRENCVTSVLIYRILLGCWRREADLDRACHSLEEEPIFVEAWQDRQYTYNVTLRRVLANHCCSGKSISITYSECVFVALVTQHATLMRLYNIFPHYLINGTISGKKSYWAQNVCFDFLYNFCLKHFSF